MSDQTQEPKTDVTPTEGDNRTALEDNKEPDYLSKLVGEEGKYKAPEELAKGYDHLEKHAKLLEKENQMYKERLEELDKTSKTIDDILIQLNSNERKEIQNMDMTNPDSSNVEELVYKALERKEREKNEMSLRQKAKDKILDAFDNDQTKANEAMTNYIGNDPAKDKLVKDMSITDPDGLVRLLTSIESNSPTKANFSPTESSNMSIATNNSSQDSGMLTWSKAKEVMLKDPNTYYSRSFRDKLNKSIAYSEEIGIDFYNS